MFATHTHQSRPTSSTVSAAPTFTLNSSSSTATPSQPTDYNTLTQQQQQQQSQHYTAAVIFLHGVGSTGDELRTQLQHLVQPPLEQRFPHIKFHYPTAPSRPFTAFKGRTLPAWFDRAGYGLQWAEDSDGVSESCAQLNTLVRQCHAEGIGNERIMIGGFSMGGAQAIHAAYASYGATSASALLRPASELPVPLAGCFCIASYLPRSCPLPTSLSAESTVLATPLLFLHGSADSIVRVGWAEDTCRRLKQSGVLCLFNVYDSQMHALSSHQLDDLSTFIAQFLPRDLKPQPSMPTDTTQQAGIQQQHQQQRQQAEHAKSAQCVVSMRVVSPSDSSSSSSEEDAGMSAYLEALKPLNNDLR